ncbi:MAG: hypothetical protein ACMUEL_01500 [Flavobacteriales bacterium Tduv]
MDQKLGKLYYGYKKHIGWGEMILAVHGIAANEYDSIGLKALIAN